MESEEEDFRTSFSISNYTHNKCGSCEWTEIFPGINSSNSMKKKSDKYRTQFWLDRRAGEGQHGSPCCRI